MATNNPSYPYNLFNRLGADPGLDCLLLISPLGFAQAEHAEFFIANLAAHGIELGGSTLTPASQAEAEAGTEAGLRSFSPLRIRQAISTYSFSKGETNAAISAAIDGPIQDAINAAVVGLLDYKGTLAANTNPPYPAALKGDVWVISLAGKIGGVSGLVVEAGDTLICNTSGVAGTHAAAGARWNLVQGNLSTGSFGLSLLASASKDNARGLLGIETVAQASEALLVHSVDGVTEVPEVPAIDPIPAQPPPWNGAVNMTTVFNARVDLNTFQVTWENGHVTFQFNGTGDGGVILMGADLNDAQALANAVKNYFDNNQPGIATFSVTEYGSGQWYLDAIGSSAGYDYTLWFEDPTSGVNYYAHGEAEIPGQEYVPGVPGVTDEPGVQQVVLYAPAAGQRVWFDSASIHCTGNDAHGPDSVEIGYVDTYGTAGTPGEFHFLYGIYLGTLSSGGPSPYHTVRNAADYFPPDNGQIDWLVKGLEGAALVVRTTGALRFYTSDNSDVIANVRFTVGG